MKIKILFSLIILLASILRVWQLDKIPPSLNWDEVNLGVNGYSILKTGQDEWGQSFPLSFRAYGDYKLPGYVYFNVPSIAVLGLNEWGVRLPSALLGVGLVVLLFLILKELSDIKTALWGAFLTATLPWAVILSRIALEAQLALFLTTAAFYSFLLGLRHGNFLIISGLLFGLTIFSYNSSRVVTPLLILSLSLIFWKELTSIKKVAVLSISIFLIFFAIALPNALLQDSSARYRWIAILDEGAVTKINELRGSSALPLMLTPLAYNKVAYFIPEVIKNYLSHFDPDFLFLNGGSNYQFSIPGSGLIYPVLIPFLILGLWTVLKIREKWQLFAVTWLLISIIPAAITRDSPHALRSLMIIPPLIIISSLGIEWIIRVQKVWQTIIVIALLLSLYIFWQNYTGDYIKNYSWSWQYGYKQVVDFIKANYNEYDQIVVTKKYGEPHEFILFYWPWDSQIYRNDLNLIRFHQSDWYWVDRFDKFYFVNDWQIPRLEDGRWKLESGGEVPVKGRTLLITSPDNFPNGWKIIKIINFLDNKPAFNIVEHQN